MTKPTLNWRGFVLAVICAVSTGFGATARAADFDPFGHIPDPPTAVAEETPAANVDHTDEAMSLTDALELDVRGSLRRTTRGHYVRVQLENVTDEPISGPVYLDVLATGIDGLTAEKPVLMLEADDELAPGRKSSVKTLRFESDERLTADERAMLDLDYDLVREADDADLATLNEKYGLPADAKTFPGVGYGPRDLERVARIKRRHEDRLFAHAGVHGVGIVDVNGRLAIRTHIDRLGNANDLPKTIGGVPVDPKVTSRVSIVPPTRRPKVVSAEATTGRFRPLRMGTSINNWDSGRNSAGTLGFFAKNSAGDVFGVTNWHVIDNTFGDYGDDIVQPGRLDGGVSGDDIGTYAGGVPPVYGDYTNNEIDAAILKIKPGMSIDPTTVSGIAISTSTVNAYPNLLVQKHGRTTDFTEGIVKVTNMTTLVGPFGNNKTARFVGVIQIDGLNGQQYSGSGDSGSLVFTKNGKKAVGLHFAGNGICCPINKVLAKWNLTILNTPVTVAVNRTYTLRVWNDQDGDGRQDSGEGGLGYMKMWMWDHTEQQWTYKYTNSSGFVSFTVKQGQWYRFWISPPSGYIHSPANVGSNDSIDSDFATDHFTPWFNVSGNRSDVDAGLAK